MTGFWENVKNINFLLFPIKIFFKIPPVSLFFNLSIPNFMQNCRKN